MLKHVSCLALASVFCVSLTGCGGDLSVPPGLLPEVYYLKEMKGELPEGWFFSSSSRFEFKILGDEKDYDEQKWLPDGQWRMPYYPALPDGGLDSANYNPNGAMIWSDTPFDQMSCLHIDFHYGEKDGTPVMGAHFDPKSQKATEDWGPFIFGKDYSVLFVIGAMTKDNLVKRTFTINVCRFLNEKHSKLTLSLTFMPR